MQFVQLWAIIQNVHLNEEVKDDIIWKLVGNGQYSAAYAYKLQFFGLIESSLNKIVWKALDATKSKESRLACLALQNI
jgi:hypothetical protein